MNNFTNVTVYLPLALPPAETKLEKRTAIVVLVVSIVAIIAFCLKIFIDSLLRKRKWIPTKRTHYFVERTEQTNVLLKNFQLQSLLMVKWSLWFEAVRPMQEHLSTLKDKSPVSGFKAFIAKTKAVFEAWLASVKESKGTNVFPVLFISLFVCGSVILSKTLPEISRLNSGEPFDDEYLFSIEKQAFIALLQIFLGLLGFYVDRMVKFYKVKFYNRRQIKLFRETKTASKLPADKCSETDNSGTVQFINAKNLKRRFKHLSPQFSWWDKRVLGNYVSIFTAMFEFFQLLMFPLYELFHSYYFRKALDAANGSSGAGGAKSVLEVLEGFTQTVQSWLPQLDSYFLSVLQYLLVWWLTVAMFIVTIIVVFLRYMHKKTKPTSNRYLLILVESAQSPTWILDLFPVIALIYIPVIQTYFSTLSCLVDWSSNNSLASLTFSRRDRCLQVTSQPQVYSGMSIVGFVISYYLMTALRTSNEPKPSPGIISLTSRSEVVNKNGAVLLLLIYSIFSVKGIQSAQDQVPDDPLVVVRGVLACLISLFLVVFNSVVGACYVLSVNCMKVLGYLLVFWTCVVVTFYTNPANASYLELLHVGAVWIVLGVGWVVLILVFALFWELFWKPKIISQVQYVQREQKKRYSKPLQGSESPTKLTVLQMQLTSPNSFLQSPEPTFHNHRKRSPIKRAPKKLPEIPILDSSSSSSSLL